MSVTPGVLASRFCCNFSIVVFKLGSNSGELNIGGVESVAVCDDLGDICMKLSGSHVLVGPQVVLNCGKIHGFGYDFGVVRNSQGNWVHWLSKRP